MCSIFSGHDGVVFALTFSSDASRLYSVSDDRSVRCWDISALHAPNEAGLAGIFAPLAWFHFIRTDLQGFSYIPPIFPSRISLTPISNQLSLAVLRPHCSRLDQPCAPSLYPLTLSLRPSYSNAQQVFAGGLVTASEDGSCCVLTPAGKLVKRLRGCSVFLTLIDSTPNHTFCVLNLTGTQFSLTGSRFSHSSTQVLRALSLSHTHTYTHTNTHIYTYTHTHTLVLRCFHPHTGSAFLLSQLLRAHHCMQSVLTPPSTPFSPLFTSLSHSYPLSIPGVPAHHHSSPSHPLSHTSSSSQLSILPS